MSHIHVTVGPYQKLLSLKFTKLQKDNHIFNERNGKATVFYQKVHTLSIDRQSQIYEWILLTNHAWTTTPHTASIMKRTQGKRTSQKRFRVHCLASHFLNVSLCPKLVALSFSNELWVNSGPFNSAWLMVTAIYHHTLNWGTLTGPDMGTMLIAPKIRLLDGRGDFDSNLCLSVSNFSSLFH